MTNTIKEKEAYIDKVYNRESFEKLMDNIHYSTIRTEGRYDGLSEFGYNSNETCDAWQGWCGAHNHLSGFPLNKPELGDDSSKLQAIKLLIGNIDHSQGFDDLLAIKQGQMLNNIRNIILKV